MQQITLNFDKVTTWNDLYDVLKTVCSQPPKHFRRDLDTIWRCLRGSFSQPTQLILESLTTLPKELYPAIPVLRQMFRDLEREEQNLTVLVTDEAALDALSAQPEEAEEELYFF